MELVFPNYKLTTIGDGGEFLKFEYENIYEKDGSRLIVAPRINQIDVMLDLVKFLRPPFIVLYVLQVGNEEIVPGRYELDQSFSYEELTRFFRRFRDFFENDGRHHIWVRSDASDATLVYDQHNVIYAYGPLDEFEKVCMRNGLSQGNVEIPFPHVHAFQARFDDELVALLSEWTWIRSDLVEGVDEV